MNDLKVLTSLLDKVRNDYKFDNYNELTIDPTQEFTIEEYQTLKYFFDNRLDLLENELELRGLDIDGFNPNEITFVLYDGDLYQGRTVSQAEANEKLAMISLTFMIIIALGLLANNLA